MDCRKEGSSSSSSFTAELFGTKDSPPSSSTGIFASIFPPPATVLGRKSSSSEVIGSWQKQPFGNQAWNTKHGAPAATSEAASYNMPNKDKNSIFMEEKAEPCHLSSSLYYGGQDNYSQPPSSHISGSYPPVLFIIRTLPSIGI
ncbi:uncharacterized protein LOC110609483 isoform X2 [Manihot esculenta]|uniref:uncharacterized protein LOC110609483 isoform X2 n=1 Tax=Manihot esculenta TaxID=3983 RepID=UPI000B5D78DE|nr:uncharacterized protein LOC110609483 isoform X2 [Manihot esculenta]XP_043810094.1 uncharacterized protein LOC110609483 isoform X2 [Manihot esculenta]